MPEVEKARRNHFSQKLVNTAMQYAEKKALAELGYVALQVETE